MARESELKRAAAKFKKFAEVMEELAPVSKKIDEMLGLLKTPGEKTADRAKKKSNEAKVTKKKVTPKRVTQQPVHSGQIPDGRTKEFPG